MSANSKNRLEYCWTLMLDMDGTLLDLAYDNYLWLTLVPQVYAQRHRLPDDEARERLYGVYKELEGTLDWYCLDHWSERLSIDVMSLHREHREKIDYLPGAQRFLETVASSHIRVLLVTNSHQDTLSLKAEVTGLDVYFDGIYSSHGIGHAKEDQSFWRAIQDAESFDPETTLFVDDNVAVLRSAETFGLRNLLQVTRPDTGRPERRDPEFHGIESVAQLAPGKTAAP